MNDSSSNGEKAQAMRVVGELIGLCGKGTTHVHGDITIGKVEINQDRRAVILENPEALAELKERYGGRWVRVRGAAKVMCHLMFGLVALTATVLFARLC